ncbi:MAG: LysR family transcriptional regulator [Clostridiales bacterium]|nr:LysR family transcriptional regulator [Clostridiales bacterium]
MKTSSLNEFLILAEYLNYSKAAATLSISQSALSRHIMMLEKELGVPLFHRTTQKIVLTSYGRAFLPHAAAILEHTNAFQRTVEDIRGDTANRIAVGSCGFPNRYGMTALFAAFKKETPDAVIDVHISSTDDMLKLLHDGVIEVAFVHNITDFTGEYETLPFCEDHISAVVPFDHPLAGRETIHLSELKDEVFYLRHKSETLMDSFEMSALRAAGFEPKLSSSTGTWGDSVINRGRDVSLIMQGLADKLRSNVNISVLEVEPRIHTDVCLIYPKSGALSPLVQEFVNFAAQYTPPNPEPADSEAP